MKQRILFPKITITGDLGSGKSLVARLLQQHTSYRIYSTGAIQREIAASHGMTTLELNRYAETHPEIDAEIDAFSKKLGQRTEPLIVDSRLAWFFIPDSFKIFLEVDVDTAVSRILEDSDRKSETYKDRETARNQLIQRKSSENKRFLRLYGADCEDADQFDLVIDTTSLKPEQVLARIIEGFQAWQKEP